MNSSYYRFILDMHSVQSQISIPASLYDTARTLYITFTDGGKPYHIDTGCLAKLSITRPSGTKIHEFCAIDGNTSAVYDFSQNPNTCVEEGIHECELTLYGLDGAQITSPRFSMVVSERVVNIDGNHELTDEYKGIIDGMVQNEQARRDAEFIRVENETVRCTNELERESSELNRVAADEERTAGYKKVEHDTAESVRKILSQQESIIAIQNALVTEGEFVEAIDDIIALQEGYIGGDGV